MGETPGPWKLGGFNTTLIISDTGMIADVLGPNINTNAALIVAACNACQQINPQNPQAAAEAFPDVVRALRNLFALVKGEAPSLLEDDHHYEMVVNALAKLDAPTEPRDR